MAVHPDIFHPLRDLPSTATGTTRLVKPRHDILVTSGNLSRLDRVGKNPRLGALPFSPTRCLYTTDCSVLTLVDPGGRQADAGACRAMASTPSSVRRATVAGSPQARAVPRALAAGDTGPRL